MARKIPTRGSGRMLQLGRRKIELWLENKEYEALAKLAVSSHMAVAEAARWLLRLGYTHRRREGGRILQDYNLLMRE